MGMGSIRLVVSFMAIGVLMPVAAWSQGTGGIAGVVRDSTSAVLPGVTVEAASPALIEQVRTVVTDGQGVYRVVDVRPGIYAVTFTLPGFSTVVNEDIQVNTGVTATVNAALQVGALEESVTVTGASSVVDIQNTRTQTLLTRDTMDALPSGKSVQSFGAMTLGAVTTSSNLRQDVGGLDGEASTYISVHGGRGTDMKLLQDGMNYNWAAGPGGGGAHRSIFPNQAAIQEVVMETTGATAEAETGGVQLNIVPKDGGNQFSAVFFGAYSNGDLQSSNVDAGLEARGVRVKGGVKSLYDSGVGVGGPIRQDRLWFYTAHRKWNAEAFVPNNFFNATLGTLFYTPDLSRPAHTWQPSRDHSVRFTSQVSDNNKLTFSVQRAVNCTCFNGIERNRAPEATYYSRGKPWLFQSTWSNTQSSRLLLQAGWTLGLNYRFAERVDGSLPSHIAITELSTGYQYGSKSSGSRITLGDLGDSTQHQTNGRFSATYITGSHAVKAGVYLHQGYAVRDQVLNDPSVNYRFRNQVPNSIAFIASPHYDEERSRTLAFYLQDQWTVDRLTLNLGLRYDQLHEWVPDQVRPAGVYAEELRIDEIKNVPNWKDVSPRLGFAYDVFGDGKTAIKASYGRYLESDGNRISSANNPALNIVTRATRTWNDDGDFIPQESELGPLSDNAFGTVRITSRWDPELLEGFLLRGASWQGSLSLEHQLADNVGVMLGFFRTSYSNFRTNNNLLVGPADYDEFCVTVPQDPQLPNAGSQICGLYDIKPEAFGQVNTLITDASNFGEASEVYQGG